MFMAFIPPPVRFPGYRQTCLTVPSRIFSTASYSTVAVPEKWLKLGHIDNTPWATKISPGFVSVMFSMPYESV